MALTTINKNYPVSSDELSKLKETFSERYYKGQRDGLKHAATYMRLANPTLTFTIDKVRGMNKIYGYPIGYRVGFFNGIVLEVYRNAVEVLKSLHPADVPIIFGGKSKEELLAMSKDEPKFSHFMHDMIMKPFNKALLIGGSDYLTMEHFEPWGKHCDILEVFDFHECGYISGFYRQAYIQTIKDFETCVVGLMEENQCDVMTLMLHAINEDNPRLVTDKFDFQPALLKLIEQHKSMKSSDIHIPWPTSLFELVDDKNDYLATQVEMDEMESLGQSLKRLKMSMDTIPEEPASNKGSIAEEPEPVPERELKRKVPLVKRTNIFEPHLSAIVKGEVFHRPLTDNEKRLVYSLGYLTKEESRELYRNICKNFKLPANSYGGRLLKPMYMNTFSLDTMKIVSLIFEIKIKSLSMLDLSRKIEAFLEV